MLDLGLGLYADSLFGLIAVINSYIGIRQELKAKATLDELAVLVAPRAKVVRDGAVAEVLATEVVPGDVVRVEPGDQLVADGEVGVEPNALNRPMLPNNCCRNDASVPGDGVWRATIETGTESSWFSCFTSCSTP